MGVQPTGSGRNWNLGGSGSGMAIKGGCGGRRRRGFCPPDLTGVWERSLRSAVLGSLTRGVWDWGKEEALGHVFRLLVCPFAENVESATRWSQSVSLTILQ